MAPCTGYQRRGFQSPSARPSRIESLTCGPNPGEDLFGLMRRIPAPGLTIATGAVEPRNQCTRKSINRH